MKDCNPCKEKETTTQCNPNPCDFVYKMPVDECTNKVVYYITLASAVLMGCNDDKTVEQVLEEIKNKLTELDYITSDSAWQILINKITAYLKTHLTELDPQLREYVNNLITEYFDNIDFDSLNTLFTNLFADWKAHLDSLLESIAGSIQFDNTPTLGSNNVVTSDGIAKALNNLEQPDWNETDSNKHSFIKNKPNISASYPNTIHVCDKIPTDVENDQIYVKYFSSYQYNFLKLHADDPTDPDDLGIVICQMLGNFKNNNNEPVNFEQATYGTVAKDVVDDQWRNYDSSKHSSLESINDNTYRLPVTERTKQLLRNANNRGVTLDVSLVNRCINEMIKRTNPESEFTFNIVQIDETKYIDNHGDEQDFVLKNNCTYFDCEHKCYVYVYTQDGIQYIKFIPQPIDISEESIMDTMDLNDVDFLYSLGMQLYLVHSFSEQSKVKINLNARNSSSIYGTTLLGSFLFHANINNFECTVNKYTVDEVKDCETGGSCVPVPDPTIN